MHVFLTVSNNKEERKELRLYYVNPHFSMLAKAQANHPMERMTLVRPGWLKVKVIFYVL